MHVILSALLFIFALPPISMPVVGCFFLLPVFIHHINNKNSATWVSGMLLGIIISGYIFFGTWTYDITVYLLVILLTTISITLLVSSVIFLIKINKILAVFVAPCIWLAIEITLHSIHIPSTLSLVLMPMNILLMPAEFGGQYLLAVLLIVFQVIYLITYIKVKECSLYVFVPVTVAPVLIIFLMTFIIVPTTNENAGDPVTVSIVQSNIHPLTTLGMPSDGNIEMLYKTRLKFIKAVSRQKIKSDIIIWPEVNFSKYEFRNNDNISNLADQYKIDMLVASPDIDPSGHSYSSVFAVSSNGDILSRRSKKLLIPFIENDISRDIIWKPHYFLPGRPGTLVCFESAFPAPAVTLAATGAGFIVIMTNDAYAGPSILPLLHLQLARLRALETGKTVLRAANGGTSAIIDKRGRIIEKLPLFSEGIITRTIHTNYYRTFYVRYFETITATYKMLSVISLLIILIVITVNKISHLQRTIQFKTIGYSFISIVVLLLFQYLFMKNMYTTATDKSLPSGFINFQNGLINTHYKYTSLKASSETGSLISAITFLLRDYGNNINIRNILPYFSRITDADVDLATIANIANQYNYSIKTIDYSTDDGNFIIATPCLALLDNGETVVIRDFTDSRTTIFSPYSGTELSLKTASFIKKWTGRTVVLITKHRHWDP